MKSIMSKMRAKERFDIVINNLAIFLSPKKISLCFNEIGDKKNRWAQEKLEGNGWERDMKYEPNFYCLKNAMDTKNYGFMFTGTINRDTTTPIQFNGEIEDAMYFPTPVDCYVHTFEDEQRFFCDLYY